jgi:bisphosphoglycerate-dependent phosphoglycerate mutase
MADVVKLPAPVSPSADEHAQAETQRDEQLFAWADAVLKALGLDKAVAAAKSVEELRRITFDIDSTKVITAIRNALHPTSGRRQRTLCRAQGRRAQDYFEEPVHRVEEVA